MKNIERVLFIIGIVFVIFISLFSRNQMKKEQNELVHNLNSVNISNNYIRRFEVASNGIELNGDMKLIGVKNDTILMNHLFFDNAVLFLKLPESECTVCIDSILLCINEAFGYENKNVAILATESNLRSLRLKHKNNSFFNNLYYSTELDGVIPAIGEGLTCFFLMNNDLFTKHFFIPDRNNTQQTRWYLHFIQNEYFKH